MRIKRLRSPGDSGSTDRPSRHKACATPASETDASTTVVMVCPHSWQTSMGGRPRSCSGATPICASPAPSGSALPVVRVGDPDFHHRRDGLLTPATDAELEPEAGPEHDDLQRLAYHLLG